MLAFQSSCLIPLKFNALGRLMFEMALKSRGFRTPHYDSEILQSERDESNVAKVVIALCFLVLQGQQLLH